MRILKQDSQQTILHKGDLYHFAIVDEAVEFGQVHLTLTKQYKVSPDSIMSGSYAASILCRYAENMFGLPNIILESGDIDIYTKPKTKELDKKYSLWGSWPAKYSDIEIINDQTLPLPVQLIYSNPAANILIPTLNQYKKPIFQDWKKRYEDQQIKEDEDKQQLIHALDIIAAYDLALSQVAFFQFGPDTYIVYSDQFMQSLFSQTIMLARAQKELSNAYKNSFKRNKDMYIHLLATIKRIHKYHKRTGFHIEQDLIEDCQAILEIILEQPEWINIKDDPEKKDYRPSRIVSEEILHFFNIPLPKWYIDIKKLSSTINW